EAVASATATGAACGADAAAGAVDAEVGTVGACEAVAHAPSRKTGSRLASLMNPSSQAGSVPAFQHHPSGGRLNQRADNRVVARPRVAQCLGLASVSAPACGCRTTAVNDCDRIS